MSPRSVLLLTAGNSIHSQRWARALSERGLRVVVASQQAFLEGDWGGAVLVRLPFEGIPGYLANGWRLRNVVREHDPDVMNVHYATGYGLCALASGVRPYLLSVWGSDVFDFPGKSPLHLAALRRSLGAAARIASTSQVMARRVEHVMGRATRICVTPFGVETARFSPRPRPADGRLVIGTVKTLAPKYGIDVLLRAFARLRRDADLIAAGLAPALSLEIVGGGPQEAELRRLAVELGLDPAAVFKGPVPHIEVPRFLNGFDVYVAASRLDSESFGVAVIEASACGLPVVVSDAGGLPEVVRDGVTGIVVPREDPERLSQALKRLVLDPAARQSMGRAGLELVRREYEWGACVDTLIRCYGEVVPLGRPARGCMGERA